MKNLVLILTVLFSSASYATTEDSFWNAGNLLNDQECLLKVVRSKMKSLKSSPAPTLKLESHTSLEEFQDAIEKLWGFRPSAFVNVFDATSNTIFLSNTKSRYKHPRTL